MVENGQNANGGQNVNGTRLEAPCKCSERLVQNEVGQRDVDVGVVVGEEAARAAPKVLQNDVDDGGDVLDEVGGDKQPEPALEQIVHVSDDECDVKQRKKVGNILDREDLVQQRFISLVVRLIVFKVGETFSNSLGQAETRITTNAQSSSET